MIRPSTLLALALASMTAAPAWAAVAQDASAPPPATEATRVPPFGASLFDGAFAGQREDGINADYRVLPGDQVRVNIWGAAEINDVFAVDAQGNMFVPGVGPIHLAGVRAADLTGVVRREVAQRYRSGFEVYTNLVTASPVAVYVTGAVVRPGRYAGIPSDSVLFFIDQAGGIEARTGSYRDVRLVRAGQIVEEVDLYDFLLRGTLSTPQLADGDVILVGRRGPAVEVSLPSGERVAVELHEGEAGAELIREIAHPGARVNEVTVRGVRDGVPVTRAMTFDAFATADLQDGDVVTFREAGHAASITVRLEGEFLGPSTLSVPRGARLLDVLNLVPVDPTVAHYDAVHIQRASVAAQQAATIQDSLDRLQRSAMLALSESTGESQIRVREAELMNAFIERARTIQPLGRVVTVSGGTQLNVMLEEGDVIVIPTRTNVIRVGGEVQVTQAVMYHPNLRVRDYVRMAGGFTNRAETRTVIVLRQNAEVFIADGGTHIRPGDEILVPPRIDRKVFQHAIDISQIVYQIAVAASVLLRV